MIKKLLSLFAGRKDLKPVIIVSGLPRSGTSLMMKMLEAGGITVLTDNMREADDDNPKGYYEFEKVKMLPEGNHTWLTNAHGKAVKIIFSLLSFLPPTYSYRAIFMRRSMPEIIASQRKMLIRNEKDPDSVSEREIALLFEKLVSEVYFVAKRKDNFSFIEVNYKQLLDNPIPELHQISNFLGKDLNVDKMAQVIDHTLYRQRHISDSS